MQIEYTKRVSYMGRNGEGKQDGIVVDQYPDTVVLGPVNSKGDVANCWIEIPHADIDKVIAELQRIKSNPKN